MHAHVLSNLVALALCGLTLLAVVSLRRQPRWRQATGSLWRRRPVALVVLALYALIGLLDSLAWTDPTSPHHPRSVVDRVFPHQFRERSYSAPMAAREFYGDRPLRHPRRHLLGTDILGRDGLRQTLKGVRVALLVGGFTSLLVIPLALFFGMTAGYFGRRVDDAVVFAMSTLASMPDLLLLVALVMAMGRGTTQVCVALGVTSWVGFSRVVRGETLKLRELEYITAARALGASHTRILLRHILPNLLHLVVITFVLLFSGLVLSEAILSWLGLGIHGSWGQMIDQARDELARDPVIWWNLSAAAAALFTLILSVNAVGDGLRDVLDPRTLRETP
jgi:peptide/nickel transport system permease protein